MRAPHPPKPIAVALAFAGLALGATTATAGGADPVKAATKAFTKDLDKSVKGLRAALKHERKALFQDLDLVEFDLKHGNQVGPDALFDALAAFRDALQDRVIDAQNGLIGPTFALHHALTDAGLDAAEFPEAAQDGADGAREAYLPRVHREFEKVLQQARDRAWQCAAAFRKHVGCEVNLVLGPPPRVPTSVINATGNTSSSVGGASISVDVVVAWRFASAGTATLAAAGHSSTTSALEFVLIGQETSSIQPVAGRWEHVTSATSAPTAVQLRQFGDSIGAAAEAIFIP